MCKVLPIFYQSLITVHLYGCLVVSQMMVLSIKFIKELWRVVYRHFPSSFEILLDKDKGVSIHLRTLMLEIYNSINNLNPIIMWDIFLPKLSKYELRSGINLKLPQVPGRKRSE